MFLTTHAAAGIFISHYVKDPYAVFGLSFASHFVLDFIPHGDEGIYGSYEVPNHHHRFRRAFFVNLVDVGILIGMTLWAIGQSAFSDRTMLIGIIGSVLPDFLSNFFPILHERLSWLALVRWLYSLSKPTGVRYLIRLQDWIHNLLHHEIFRRDIPFLAGLTMQLILVSALMFFSR